MKQQLKTKEAESQAKQKITKIVKYIEAFKKVEKSFKINTIKLVSEVIDLKRVKNPEYNFINLLEEKEIKPHAQILEKYIPYDVSPGVSKLYIEGKLDNLDMMAIGNLKTEFKDPEKLGKIVDGILDNKISGKELFLASSPEIREMIGEDPHELEEDRRALLETLYQLRRIPKLLKENAYLFKGSAGKDNKKKLIESMVSIKVSMKRILGVSL